MLKASLKLTWGMTVYGFEGERGKGIVTNEGDRIIFTEACLNTHPETEWLRIYIDTYVKGTTVLHKI